MIDKTAASREHPVRGSVPPAEDRIGSKDRSHLDRYFGELSGLPLMTREEEVEAAREVEQREVDYWQALLSDPRAVDIVRKVIGTEGEQTAEVSQLLATLAHTATDDGREAALLRVAQLLRGLDSERSWARAVDGLVHEWAVDVPVSSATRAYLERVRVARLQQFEAKHRFVAANLRLVVAVARRYNKGQLPFIDLIQEGNLGLMKAVERFDHTRGFRFSTYASWWIRHAVTRAIADKGRVVRVPVRVLEARRLVSRTIQRLSARDGEAPGLAELAQETGLPENRLDGIGQEGARALSLDRPIGDAEGQTFVDMLPDEERPSPYEDVETTEFSDELHRLLDSLSPMEAQVLRLRFGLGNQEEMTLKTIGDRFHLSRERIRQIQEQALGKIRRQIQV